jgi:hypothetical protein
MNGNGRFDKIPAMLKISIEPLAIKFFGIMNDFSHRSTLIRDVLPDFTYFDMPKI